MDVGVNTSARGVTLVQFVRTHQEGMWLSENQSFQFWTHFPEFKNNIRFVVYLSPGPHPLPTKGCHRHRDGGRLGLEDHLAGPGRPPQGFSWKKSPAFGSVAVPRNV